MSVKAPVSELFSVPLLKSAFRPFYLFGSLYGIGIMGLWILSSIGYFDVTFLIYSKSIWHGHEMVFGFSGAIVAGFVLTALPSWAGTEEINRGKLAFLVLLWGLGRIAFYYDDLLPAYVGLIVDSSLFFVAGIMVTPGLLRARNKYYLALLPIFLLLGLGNVIFYLAVMEGDMIRASWGIHIGLMGIVAKFILAGGFLTTVFTGNALKEKKLPALVFIPALEYLSALSLLLFIYGALADISQVTSGTLALIAAFVQLIRFLRWRTLKILDSPLVLTMHLAYLWFIGALILFGAARFNVGIAPEAWLHAFTVGALSMMMLSLITRVALRHTGRPLVPAPIMLMAFGIMFICAFLRVLVSVNILPVEWLPATAFLWAAAFLIYVLRHAPYLIKPSLPKRKSKNN